VRAGLELIAAVTALKSPVPLQTRVGIATGMVVVKPPQAAVVKSDGGERCGNVGI
jgi:class 3 adenylate cyclase